MQKNIPKIYFAIISRISEEEGCEFPEELARLLDQEQRKIQPHQELVDVINLGTEENKKKVKIGVSLQLDMKGKLLCSLKKSTKGHLVHM